MDFVSLQVFKGFESNLNQNSPGLNTWLFLIGCYRFDWIKDVGCQIIRGSDGPDLTIPIRISDLFLSLGSKSNGCQRTRERSSSWG
jgi:hypothetical protein